MQCQTVRPGTECFFWKKSGCSYNNSQCNEIVTECEGCSNVSETGEKKFCSKYPEPALKWLTTTCNMATHIKKEEVQTEAKKINPLKASKRLAAGRKK